VHYRTFVDLLMMTMKLWLTNMILHNKSGHTLSQNIQGLAPVTANPYMIEASELSIPARRTT
jgi:hypothetical protein